MNKNDRGKTRRIPTRPQPRIAIIHSSSDHPSHFLPCLSGRNPVNRFSEGGNCPDSEKTHRAGKRCSNDSNDWARELFSLFPPDPIGSGCQRTPDHRSHIAPTDLQATLLGLPPCSNSPERNISKVPSSFLAISQTSLFIASQTVSLQIGVDMSVCLRRGATFREPRYRDLGVQSRYAVPIRRNAGSGDAFLCGRLYSHRR